MIEALKKTLYAGIGATVMTAERIEHSLQDLVEKGKLSAEEAREAAKKISKDSKKEFEDAQSSLKDLFNELLEKADVATKDDLKPLRKRIDALEKKIGKLEETEDA